MRRLDTGEVLHAAARLAACRAHGLSCARHLAAGLRGEGPPPLCRCRPRRVRMEDGAFRAGLRSILAALG